MKLEEAIDKLNNFKTIKILYGNTFIMHIEQLEKIQKSIETILQALKNSIPKKKIEDKIKEWDESIKWNNADDHYYAIKILQELLEDK